MIDFFPLSSLSFRRKRKSQKAMDCGLPTARKVNHQVVIIAPKLGQMLAQFSKYWHSFYTICIKGYRALARRANVQHDELR